jgi:hypothetical protein
MNPATQIIYKAKDINGVWQKGNLLSRKPDYYICDFNNDSVIHSAILINSHTLCIGCVIDGKEYFAGDKSEEPYYGAGKIRFEIERGFFVAFLSRLIRSLSECHSTLTITGNIHD